MHERMPGEQGVKSDGTLRSSAHERFERDVVCLLGLPFDCVGLNAAVDKLRAAAATKARCFVSTPNLNFLVAARSDPAFRDSVLRSDLSLADGAPIVWMARLLGLPIPERVAGASVFEALRAHPGPPLGVFFFGGPPGSAEAACRNLNAAAGGLRCVGFDDAGYGSMDDMSAPERIEKINRSGASFVVVALGAKKGQAWIERNLSALDAPLVSHLGAVVNFVAGTVNRAPPWVQGIGLEWLWRIKEEPGLWRRYLGDGLSFTRLASAQALRRLRPRSAHRTPEPACTWAAEPAPNGGLALRLSGAWGRDDLQPLRQAFAEAALQGRTIDLFLNGVSRIDAACVGLLLLAHGSLGHAGLRLREVPDAIRATLIADGAAYLLDSTAGS